MITRREIEYASLLIIIDWACEFYGVTKIKYWLAYSISLTPSHFTFYAYAKMCKGK